MSTFITASSASASPGILSTLTTTPTTTSDTTTPTTSTTPARALSTNSHVTRSRRLRGLNYLRTCTQNYRLSRDGNNLSADSSSSSPAPAPAPSLTPPVSPAQLTLTRQQSTGPLPTLTTLATSLTTLTRSATSPHIGRVSRRPTSGAQGLQQDVPASTASVRGTSEEATANEISSGNRTTTTTPHPGARVGPVQIRAPEPVIPGHSVQQHPGPRTPHAAVNMTRTRSSTTGDLSHDPLPTIRMSAYYDPRSNRQSLSFAPVSRTLPSTNEVIKVGRYSERENHNTIANNTPSSAPVGFKSKVVSRRHCEFWFENGKWYIKDVKSSSGTFLNHIRLSPPGTESKPFPLNDGDIVQLGIDFRGGEEMIFRCVKMRIELNRGWQTKPNTFNMATHKSLRNMTSSTGSHAQDCSICLSAIAPCQSLFVAPCSHTWHYKCIREMLVGPTWPNFICPNCRAATDLDADIEEPEEWEQLDAGIAEVVVDEPSSHRPPLVVDRNATPVNPTASHMEDEAADTSLLEPVSPAAHLEADSQSTPTPAPAAVSQTSLRQSTAQDGPGMRTPSPPGKVNGSDGPTTPRNDVGPWVFDGEHGRASQEASRQSGDIPAGPN